MPGPELAVVGLAALCFLTLGCLAALLLQVRRLRAELQTGPRAEPGIKPPDEVRLEPRAEPPAEPLTAPPAWPPGPDRVESDAAVRIVPRVGAETSLSAGAGAGAGGRVPSRSLVRAAAVAHGVRCALAAENRDRIRSLVRRDVRRRQKLRLRAARRAARVLPIDSSQREDLG